MPTMRTNGQDRRGGTTMMHRTKTWIILYALGIAMLVLSLCQSEPEKPAKTPRPPVPVSHRAAAPHSELPLELTRP